MLLRAVRELELADVSENLALVPADDVPLAVQDRDRRAVARGRLPGAVGLLLKVDGYFFRLLGGVRLVRVERVHLEGLQELDLFDHALVLLVRGARLDHVILLQLVENLDAVVELE